MKKTIAISAAFLLGTATVALAQNRGGSTSPGASQYSPGHEMQRSKSTPDLARPNLARATKCATREPSVDRGAPRNTHLAIV